MRISDWSSDVCSSVLAVIIGRIGGVSEAIGGVSQHLGAAVREGIILLRPDRGFILVDADFRARELDRSRDGAASADEAEHRLAVAIEGREHRLLVEFRALPEFEVEMAQIGRAHVWTPVTNAHLVCRLLLEKKNN